MVSHFWYTIYISFILIITTVFFTFFKFCSSPCRAFCVFIFLYFSVRVAPCVYFTFAATLNYREMKVIHHLVSLLGIFMIEYRFLVVIEFYIPIYYGVAETVNCIFPEHRPRFLNTYLLRSNR